MPSLHATPGTALAQSTWGEVRGNCTHHQTGQNHPGEMLSTSSGAEKEAPNPSSRNRAAAPARGRAWSRQPLPCTHTLTEMTRSPTCRIPSRWAAPPSAIREMKIPWGTGRKVRAARAFPHLSLALQTCSQAPGRSQSSPLPFPNPHKPSAPRAPGSKALGGPELGICAKRAAGGLDVTGRDWEPQLHLCL